MALKEVPPLHFYGSIVNLQCMSGVQRLRQLQHCDEVLDRMHAKCTVEAEDCSVGEGIPILESCAARRMVSIHQVTDSTNMSVHDMQ